MKYGKYNLLGAYGTEETARKWAGVWCIKCGIEQPIRKYVTKEQAIEYWNMRVPQTVVNQQGENCTNITNCGTLNLSL